MNTTIVFFARIGRTILPKKLKKVGPFELLTADVVKIQQNSGKVCDFVELIDS